MTRKTITDLLPATEYALRARAVGADGAVSEWSNRFLFTTIADGDIPKTPANVTWVAIGDAFHGAWDAVTENVSGDTIPITRYEIELSGGGITKIVSVSPVTGERPLYTLSFEENRALFGTPRASITMRVRAVDNKELKSLWSAPITAVNALPDPPTNVHAEPAVGAVTVTWDAPTGSNSEDVVKYRVWVGNSASFTPSTANRVYEGNSLSFIYQTNDVTTMYFKVASVDKFNQQSATATSNGVQVTSPFVIDTEAPDTPTDFTINIVNSADGKSAVATASWTPGGETDRLGFEVAWRKTGNIPWNVVKFLEDAGSGTIYLPEAYVSYDFRIRAYDDAWNYSPWSSVITVAADANTAPAAVTGFDGDAGVDSITYTWNAVGDTDLRHYEIDIATNTGFSPILASFQAGIATSLTVGGLAPGTTYYARIRTKDQGNLTSAWSSTLTKTTGSYALTDNNAPASSPTPVLTGGVNHMIASWAPVANADMVTYEVHMSTTDGFTPNSGTKIGETAGTSYTITKTAAGAALVHGTTYRVKLIARDGDGPGPAGGQASGTTQKTSGADITAGTFTGGEFIIGSGGILRTANSEVTINNTGIQVTGANSSITASALTAGTINASGDIVVGSNIRSSNFGASAGFQLNSTGLIVRSGEVAASTLRTGTITSTTAGGPINLGTGSRLIVNGGAIRSNTYGSDNYNAGATAGFFISDTNIHIPDGEISANALSGGTVSAASIILGTDGEIKSPNWTTLGQGFRLSSAGLEIPDGSITASKLTIQAGASNLMESMYSNFESQAASYSSVTKAGTASGTLVISSAQKKYGNQSMLYTITGTSGQYMECSANALGQIPVEGGKTYIISMYVYRSSSASTSIVPAIRNQTGTYSAAPSGGPAIPITTSGAWVRYSWTHTVGANDTWISVHPRVNLTGSVSSSAHYIDAIMVEEKISDAATPSAYNPGVVTVIDGGMIRTGEIRSSATVSDGTPSWYINLDGSAVFSNAAIRGDTVIGASSSTTSRLRSYNWNGGDTYDEGTTGWAIFADGSAAFSDAYISGVIDGGTIIGGQFSTNNMTQGLIIKGGKIEFDAPAYRGLNITGPANIQIEGWDGFTSPPSEPILSIMSYDTPTVARAKISLVPNYIDFSVNNGLMRFTGASDVMGKFRTVNSSGASINFRAGQVIIGVPGYNSTTPASANTEDLHADRVFTYTGLFDASQSSGSASFNNNGRVVSAGSSARYKYNIQPLDLEVARRALNLEAVSFNWIEELGFGNRRAPGFIAEQAADEGLDLWIYYNDEGEPNGIKYAELTAAHNMLIKELYEKNETLEAEVTNLRERLENLENIVNQLTQA